MPFHFKPIEYKQKSDFNLHFNVFNYKLIQKIISQLLVKNTLLIDNKHYRYSGLNLICKYVFFNFFGRI